MVGRAQNRVILKEIPGTFLPQEYTQKRQLGLNSCSSYGDRKDSILAAESQGQRGDKVESEGNIILMRFPASGRINAHVMRI